MHSLKKIRKLFDRAGFKEIEVAEKHKAIFLSGNVDHWDRYLEAGYLAAGKGYRGVVNDIQVRGLIPDSFTVPSHSDKSLEGRHFHAAVVGGGVIGAAITRELTRWQIDVALLEKENDLSRHASGRNNGIIHPAFAAPPGSLKARYNTLGNRMFTQEAQELGVPLAWPGLLVVFPSRMMHMLMPLIRRRARQNGVRGVEYLTPEQVRAREPNIYNKQQGGFFLPEGGIVSPYKLTMAYGENAISNGAQVFLQTA
ncbi:MAG TPA: FAD-dependent oxidoreductase, partial [Candidatus Limnocylindrales bacterium]|nr:FAD-dependent oxidoreductase [Candidatus Limnocylindrales bacterium]